MYSGILKNYDRLTVRHVFTKPVQIEGKTQKIIFPRKFFFIVVQIYAARQYECMHKDIDASILTRLWQELEYRIDVCRVTRGAHIEYL
jgi:hypothetical protein